MRLSKPLEYHPSYNFDWANLEKGRLYIPSEYDKRTRDVFNVAFNSINPALHEDFHVSGYPDVKSLDDDPGITGLNHGSQNRDILAERFGKVIKNRLSNYITQLDTLGPEHDAILEGEIPEDLILSQKDTNTKELIKNRDYTNLLKHHLKGMAEKLPEVFKDFLKHKNYTDKFSSEHEHDTRHEFAKFMDNHPLLKDEPYKQTLSFLTTGH